MIAMWVVQIRKWVKTGDNAQWHLNPVETVNTVARNEAEAADRVKSACPGASSDRPTEIVWLEPCTSVKLVGVFRFQLESTVQSPANAQESTEGSQGGQDVGLSRTDSSASPDSLKQEKTED